jgi:hypothetical protein
MFVVFFQSTRGGSRHFERGEWDRGFLESSSSKTFFRA